MQGRALCFFRLTVLRLEVAVEDALLVQVGDAAEQLCSVEADVRLRQRSVLPEMVAHVPAHHERHDHEQLSVRLECVEEVAQEWRVGEGHDLALDPHHVEVGRRLQDGELLHALQRHQLLRVLLRDGIHLAEAACRGKRKKERRQQ